MAVKISVDQNKEMKLRKGSYTKRMSQYCCDSDSLIECERFSSIHKWFDISCDHGRKSGLQCSSFDCHSLTKSTAQWTNLMWRGLQAHSFVNSRNALYDIKACLEINTSNPRREFFIIMTQPQLNSWKNWCISHIDCKKTSDLSNTKLQTFSGQPELMPTLATGKDEPKYFWARNVGQVAQISVTKNEIKIEPATFQWFQDKIFLLSSVT